MGQKNYKIFLGIDFGKIFHLYFNNVKIMDRMGFEPTTFAGNYFLTQCECVIQTKLDDRSNKITKRASFLSLGCHNMSQLP